MGMTNSLKTQAYNHIRRLLLSGDLTPGVSLSPVTLAKEIGISHSPGREAISQLKSEGLVEHSSGNLRSETLEADLTLPTAAGM
jgi:DNA-binding GntR family transcriptional regulator